MACSVTVQIKNTSYCKASHFLPKESKEISTSGKTTTNAKYFLAKWWLLAPCVP